MTQINTGIVQFDILTGQTDKNIETALEGVRSLADSGSDLIILPEMFSSSFDYDNLKKHSEATPDILQQLKETAQAKNVIIAGSMPESENNNIYNTLYLIDKNGILAGRYRKVHLFSPTGENDHFQNGVAPVVCKTSVGNIGLMICYDLRFPELCRRLTDMDAQIIIISAQWPSPRVEHWDTLIKARAIENQVFIAAANRCGQSGNLIFPGHSQIISPWGKELAKAGNDYTLLGETINLDEIERARETIPCLQERVPAAYSDDTITSRENK